MTTSKSVTYIVADSLLQLALQAPELVGETQNPSLQQGLLDVIVPAMQVATRAHVGQLSMSPYFYPEHDFNTFEPHIAVSVADVKQYINTIFPYLHQIFSMHLASISNPGVRSGIGYLKTRIQPENAAVLNELHSDVLSRSLLEKNKYKTVNSSSEIASHVPFIMTPYILQLLLGASYAAATKSDNFTAGYGLAFFRFFISSMVAACQAQCASAPSLEFTESAGYSYGIPGITDALPEHPVWKQSTCVELSSNRIDRSWVNHYKTFSGLSWALCFLLPTILFSSNILKGEEEDNYAMSHAAGLATLWSAFLAITLAWITMVRLHANRYEKESIANDAAWNQPPEAAKQRMQLTDAAFEEHPMLLNEVELVQWHTLYDQYRNNAAARQRDYNIEVAEQLMALQAANNIFRNS